MITKRKVTGIRLPSNLNKKITDLAKYKGMTKNSLIVDALWKHVQSNSINKYKEDKKWKEQNLKRM